MGMADLLLGQLMPGFDMDNIMKLAKDFTESFQQIAQNIKIIQESQARTELKLEQQNKTIEELQHLIITGEFHDYRNNHNPDAYYGDQFRNDFPNRDGGSVRDGDDSLASAGLDGGISNGGTC